MVELPCGISFDGEAVVEGTSAFAPREVLVVATETGSQQVIKAS